MLSPPLITQGIIEVGYPHGYWGHEGLLSKTSDRLLHYEFTTLRQTIVLFAHEIYLHEQSSKQSTTTGTALPF